MEDILMGACASVVGRVVITLRQVGAEPEVTLTGGLTLNPAVPRILQSRLGFAPNASPDLFFAGAIGAAVLGYRRCTRKGGTRGLGG